MSDPISFDKLPNKQKKIAPSIDRQRLYSYLSFYRVYPQIAEAIPPGWISPGLGEKNIIPSDIVRTASVQLRIPGEQLLDRLSYSHFEQLTALENSLELPSKEDLQRFLEEKRREVDDGD